MTLGDSGDEMSYFKQLLDNAQIKADNVSYAERRAQEMANGDMDEDYSLEGKDIIENQYESNFECRLSCRGSKPCHGRNS